MVDLTASQVSETIRLAQRGTDRTDNVTKFVDMRISKKFAVGVAHLEGSLDISNIFNTNPVLAQNEQIGTTWGCPTSVLSPRVFRVGATVRF